MVSHTPGIGGSRSEKPVPVDVPGKQLQYCTVLVILGHLILGAFVSEWNAANEKADFTDRRKALPVTGTVRKLFRRMTEDMYLTKDPIARNTVQESTSKDLLNDGQSDIFITSLKEH